MLLFGGLLTVLGQADNDGVGGDGECRLSTINLVSRGPRLGTCSTMILGATPMGGGEAVGVISREWPTGARGGYGCHI